MRLLLLSLSLVILLSGCNESAAKVQSNDQALTETSADTTEAVALVNSKKQIGHRNFNSAKKILPDVFAGMEEDFYCGCKYSGKDVDLLSCGYEHRKNFKRASRIEWEHVVPASHMGSQRQCWQEGGRKNCSGNDPLFDMMEGDLNNLVPAVGEVNGDRGNMSYGMWTNAIDPVYGRCESIPDFKNKRFQPRKEVRGRAARISLYMHIRYDLKISSQDKKLWCAWAKSYPVDAWEKERNARIVRWQGEGNAFVAEPSSIGKVCG